MKLPRPTGRAMVVLPRERAVRRGIGGASYDPCWPAKDPGETVIDGVDWVWVFGGAAPSTVTAYVIPANAVVALDQEALDTATIFRFAGGADGVAATILLVATDAVGRTEYRVVHLPIVALAGSGQVAALPTQLPMAVGAIVTVALAGGGQAGAVAITSAVTIVTAAQAGDCLALQSGSQQQRTVINRSGFAVAVQPPSGGTIGTLAADVPASIDPGVTAVFDSADGTTWFAS